MLALSEIFVLAGLGVVSLSRTLGVDFKFGRVRYKITWKNKQGDFPGFLFEKELFF